ncbi:Dienelactone hydrolase (plasmid) [Phaeobacter gallaeciensis]|nr:Dienelactone hydrolase [Phaeobacter gallaeciensis]ATF24711.1 Dienelactone hydrolase [Phaeobacter gallaeciensis]
MKGLDQGLTLKDAQACVNWLAAQPEVTGKVGVVGFCLGGKLGFQLAGGSHVDSIVPYYGTGLHTVLESAAGFEGEALVHVAEADHLCPPEAQAAIASAFAENPRVTVMSYPGAGHAFARVGGDHYDEAAAERANAATLDFLHRRLSVENT